MAVANAPVLGRVRMARRPSVVLAMVPYFTADMFTTAHRERLGALGEVVDPEPLTAFGVA